uniref:Uncharacterized protein n=1 Tax=viral metagenome TaxID=1070528 RepID=A0A6M3IPA3_9ZZZZ
MKLEYVIWGIPEGGNDEELLYTKIETDAQARQVMGILASKYNARELRLQVIDLNTPLVWDARSFLSTRLNS